LLKKEEDPAAFRPGLSRLPLHVAFRNAQRLAGHWQGVPLSATRCSRHETRVDTKLGLDLVQGIYCDADHGSAQELSV